MGSADFANYNADPNQQQKKPLVSGQSLDFATMGAQPMGAPVQIDAPRPAPPKVGGLPPGGPVQIDAPTTAPPRVGGLPAPAPAAPAAPAGGGAIAQGWQDVGYGNLVKNTATGQMVDKNHPIYQQALGGGGQSAAPSATPGAPAAPGAPPPTVGGQMTQGAPTTVADSFKQALVNKLNPTAPSLNDPALKGQADAFHVGQERSRDAARSAMAERMAQEGGAGVNSGAFNNSLAGLYQHQGEAEGSFNAGLIGDAHKQQQADLMQALGIGGQVNEGQANRDLQGVMQDKNLSMQEKLAAMDASIRKEGLAQQGTLGQGDLDLRKGLGEGQLNLGLLTALLGHDEFGKSLAQNSAQFGAGMDQNAIFGLLAGL